MKYLNLDTDSTMEANSDYKIASQKAIKTALATKQDTLIQGDNITISNGTISATDTTYTAGTGITISNTNEISSNCVQYAVRFVDHTAS